MSLLERIGGSEDIRRCSFPELEELCSELRRELIRDVSVTGGHLASNLGIVELTVALHNVYDPARDRIVFDVGHQCYVHKMLTGRLDRFSTLRQEDGLSGRFLNVGLYRILCLFGLDGCRGGSSGLRCGSRLFFPGRQNQLRSAFEHVGHTGIQAFDVVDADILPGGNILELFLAAGHLVGAGTDSHVFIAFLFVDLHSSTYRLGALGSRHRGGLGL